MHASFEATVIKRSRRYHKIVCDGFSTDGASAHIYLPTDGSPPLSIGDTVTIRVRRK
jgi:hypothetical protein